MSAICMNELDSRVDNVQVGVGQLHCRVEELEKEDINLDTGARLVNCRHAV